MQKIKKKGEVIDQLIFADRMIILNKNLLLSIPANFSCTLLVYLSLYQIVNQKTLLIWFITTLSVFVLHGALFLFNCYRPLRLKSYLKIIISLVVIYGGLWGAAATLLIPYGLLLNLMFVIIVIVGVTSGGLHILQPNYLVSILFFSLTTIPLSIWLFYQKGIIYWLLGTAMIIYFCFLSIVSWMGYRLLNKNFKLRYENYDLINKLLEMNNSLEESESRFRCAFNSAAIGMAIISLEGRWLKVNEALSEIVGYSEKELLQTDFQSITYPDDLDLDLSYVRQLLAGDIKFYHMEKRYIHKNGSIIWILLNGGLIRNNENKPLYFIAQIQNIDAQKRAEQELMHIAHHDILTGLENRKKLEISFDHALAYAKSHQKKIAVMFLDLDNFKKINDKFGHDIGDLLLIEIAQILKSSLRSTDIIARLGGDEFIIALTELANICSVMEIARNILIAIEKPIMIKQQRILITGSIGISLCPDDGNNLNTLIKKADEALYYVKSIGKSNFRLSSWSV
ncbi:GGDEF domain-containing protein [Legionella hackeliae]|uniref:Diguanylate cyclase n=1 Tax=Legionella hackeliae TaxID=449 RepID=A0A0A8UX41_LEGHA|nr:GGDEF domain-containing protein [Legionella hackeliae]KTD10043.1 sensory box/GGDEF family protein [Legionella hackeliae]CEK11652.1 Diguanylate cyclase [Legionella hackeliae]STX48422.1 sensory box/GGDEF family protein [Legionella hackeliae]